MTGAGDLLPLAAAALAVAALVLIAHLAGFSRPATLAGRAEAEALARLAGGGFEPADAAVAVDGSAALLIGRDGTVLVLRRHGARFVAERIADLTGAAAQGGTLRLERAREAPLALALGPCSAVWARRLHPAPG